MFTNERYMTRGVQETVPQYLQNLLWFLIDSMQTESKDYLQVFALSERDGKQHIIHTQEQPPYQQEQSVDNGGFAVVTGKIFVIDDTAHSTILLAEEY